MSYKISAAQKEDIRRMTQKANRRISAAFKEYEAAGQNIVPRDLTGGIQVRKNWTSKNYAISRSVVFDSAKDYYEKLKFLKQFEIPEKKGGIPTMTEYKAVQSSKIMRAMKTSFGDATFYDLPPELMKIMEERIKNMSPVEMSQFWKKFSERSAKLKLEFSSEKAMEMAMNEFFGKETLRPLLINSILDTLGKKATKEEVAAIKTETKFMNNITLVNYLKKLQK